EGGSAADGVERHRAKAQGLGREQQQVAGVVGDEEAVELLASIAVYEIEVGAIHDRRAGKSSAQSFGIEIGEGLALDDGGALEMRAGGQRGDKGADTDGIGGGQRGKDVITPGGGEGPDRLVEDQ